MGDFDVNALQSKSPLEKHLNQHNLNISNKSTITTHHKTCLDWIVRNDKRKCGVYASYFSYHHPIWTQMARQLHYFKTYAKFSCIVNYFLF